MKTIRNILIVACVLLTASCKKFLDENPPNLGPGSDLNSVRAARALTNGAYQNLTGLLTGQPSSYGGNTYNLMEFMTGKANTDLGQTGFVNFQNLNYNNTTFYFDTWWQQMYLGVGAANLAIERLPGITAAGFEAKDKNNMLAEARALRALYYFYLVRMYGAVPKITKVPTNLGELEPSRSPAKQIYDEIIIPDLLEAEKADLPWKDATGKVSKGMVKSLLADVYLTYAGFPINGGAANYAESAKRSLEVLTAGGYTLFPNYTDMINTANKNQGEFIFQVQYAATVPISNPLTPLMVPNFSKTSKYADEYGSVWPTAQFLASFPAGDKRRAEKQFFYTSDTHITNGTTVTFAHPYIYKFYDVNAIKNTTRSDLNYTVYRLADVMLMYAEAQNRADGAPNAAAIGYLQQVRTRANNLTPVPTTQTAFEQEVWSQRYWELCFENKMWFDMIRTRKVRNDVTGNFDDFVGHTTIYGKTFTQNNLLFPVPKQETDINPKLLPNNPGF